MRNLLPVIFGIVSMVCFFNPTVEAQKSSCRVAKTINLTGDGCDGVAFDPATKRIFSSNGEGTMTVIQQLSADKYKLLANFTTQPGARIITVDPGSHHLYLSVGKYIPGTERRRTVKPNSFKIIDIEPIN